LYIIVQNAGYLKTVTSPLSSVSYVTASDVITGGCLLIVVAAFVETIIAIVLTSGEVKDLKVTRENAS
jgi:hypothetical protein